MKQYFYNYQTIVTFSEIVTSHSIKMRCVPACNEFQSVEKEAFILPEIFWRQKSIDSFGNTVIFGGTELEHHAMAYASVGVIKSSIYGMPVIEPSVSLYAMPTKITALADSQDVCKVNRTGNVIHDACQICHWVHNWISYMPNSTNMETTAADVYLHRYGVCQDYAHLMIALCRKNGILARYVNGFLEGTGATHAWVEVSDGHYWYGFDPTIDIQINYGYIKIAHGRDASDCPVSRGVYKGNCSQQTSVIVTVQEL